MNKTNLPRILIFVMLFLVVAAIAFLIWINSTQQGTGKPGTSTATPLGSAENQLSATISPSMTVNISSTVTSAITATPGGIRPPVVPIELTPVR